MTETFEAWGIEIPYCTAAYNSSRRNERAVEIPLAQAFIAAQPVDGRGLEVGNVLAHYGVTGHAVVDLYEEAPGVENIDVLEITGQWDWIVAISTIEHVRWDHPPRDPNGATLALSHLRRHLTTKGALFVTVPMGYHPPLDDVIVAGSLGAEAAATFVRDGPDAWRQTPHPERHPYGVGQPWASAVWVAEFGPIKGAFG